MVLFNVLCLVASGFFINTSRADFHSRNVSLNTPTLELDDTIVASESCNLTCKETMAGTGLIKSPKIFIKTKKFIFTGTIECTGECVIIAQQSFNKKMFKRKGCGKFKILINPSLFDAETITEPVPATHGQFESHQTIPKEELNATKEFSINGSVFTVKGAKKIELAELVLLGDLPRTQEFIQKNPALKQAEITGFMLMAGLSGHIILAEEFIKLGADVNGTDDDDFLLHKQAHLITAVIAKKSELVELLVRKGANPNLFHKDGYTALTVAVLQNDLPSVKALLKSPKIDINKKERFNSFTALMRAASAGYKDIVEVLLDAGADTSISMPGGIIAEDYARGEGHDEIVQLLRCPYFFVKKKSGPDKTK